MPIFKQSILMYQLSILKIYLIVNNQREPIVPRDMKNIQFKNDDIALSPSYLNQNKKSFIYFNSDKSILLQTSISMSRSLQYRNGQYLLINCIIHNKFYIFIIKLMSNSIREAYSISNRLDNSGIEGYYVDKKYYDAAKMKQQRILETSKDKIQGEKPINVGKKASFIDQIQKKQAKLPGPCSYQPKEVAFKSKTEQQQLDLPKRKTIFDQVEYFQKKRNFPGAGSYGQVTVSVDKAKLRSNISKAENSNYIDSLLRYSLESPGVGNYNAYHAQFDKKGNKWGKVDNIIPAKTEVVKLPPVGTYTPLPVSYQLFENQLLSNRKKSKSHFNKQQRFKKSKEKPLPFYNILSQWGMKDKNKNTDILTKISAPSTHRSVYH